MYKDRPEAHTIVLLFVAFSPTLVQMLTILQTAKAVVKDQDISDFFFLNGYMDLFACVYILWMGMSGCAFVYLCMCVFMYMYVLMYISKYNMCMKYCTCVFLSLKYKWQKNFSYVIVCNSLYVNLLLADVYLLVFGKTLRYKLEVKEFSNICLF